jgi:hypothetical protein
LAALIWYILAIGCLFTLRRREPRLFGHYRAPVARLLPAAVVVLSIFAAWVYAGIDVKADLLTLLPERVRGKLPFQKMEVDVVQLTLLLYAMGIGYFGIWGRKRLQEAAPEELAARKLKSDPAGDFPMDGLDRGPKRGVLALETITAAVLLLVLAALAWMVLAAYWPGAFRLAAVGTEVIVVLVLLSLALALVSIVALLHTRR